MKRLVIALMLLLVAATSLAAVGCNTDASAAKPVVGSTQQHKALKVRVDGLCWCWKSEATPAVGETGAFSVEIEATVKNQGRYNLHPPRFSVDGGGEVSWYQSGCREDMIYGRECKLRMANRNQVHLEFNNNDPGKEILLTVEAEDKKGRFYSLSFTLPPPLEMPRCGE